MLDKLKDAAKAVGHAAEGAFDKAKDLAEEAAEAAGAVKQKIG